MNTLGVDLNSVDVPLTDTGTHAFDPLKILINTIHPRYHRTA